jgi:hypothetical protein
VVKDSEIARKIKRAMAENITKEYIDDQFFTFSVSVEAYIFLHL